MPRVWRWLYGRSSRLGQRSLSSWFASQHSSELSGRWAEGLCTRTGAAHGFFGKAAGAGVGDPAAEDVAAGTRVDPMPLDPTLLNPMPLDPTLLDPSAVQGPFLSPRAGCSDAYSDGECQAWTNICTPGYLVCVSVWRYREHA